MSNTQITTRRAASQMSMTSGLYALANNPAFQRLVTNGLNSIRGKSFPTCPSTSSPSIQIMNGPGPKRGKRRRRRSRETGVSRGPRETAVTITGKLLIPMKTPLTGLATIRSYAAWMGYKNTNYDWDLSNSSQLSSLMNVFQYQTLKRVQFHWRPSTAYTTAGVVAMCVNSDTSTTTVASSLQSIIQKDSALSGDVKDAHTFVYTPRTEQERETKLSRDASGASIFDQRFYTPGIFWIRFETNIAANDTIVGYMEQEVTVTLERLE